MFVLIPFASVHLQNEPGVLVWSIRFQTLELNTTFKSETRSAILPRRNVHKHQILQNDGYVLKKSKLPLRQVKAIPSSKRSLASPCTSTHLRTPSLLIFLKNDCSGEKNSIKVIKAKELVGKGYHFLRRFVLSDSVSVIENHVKNWYFLKQREYGRMLMRQHPGREHSWHQRTSWARLQLHQCCLQHPP